MNWSSRHNNNDKSVIIFEDSIMTTRVANEKDCACWDCCAQAWTVFSPEGPQMIIIFVIKR